MFFKNDDIMKVPQNRQKRAKILNRIRARFTCGKPRSRIQTNGIPVFVVIYARFSSHSQTEQSIEGQLKECYEFAKRNDYNVIAEYIDRALTGTTDKRPEFLRMIEDSKKKAFKYVLVYQLDRFARNRYDSATYKAKLKKNGV